MENQKSLTRSIAVIRYVFLPTVFSVQDNQAPVFLSHRTSRKEHMRRPWRWHSGVGTLWMLPFLMLTIVILGVWRLCDFGAATYGSEPTERTDEMWPTEQCRDMPASVRTDRVMLANTLLLITHHRTWRDGMDTDTLRACASKISLESLKNLVLELLSWFVVLRGFSPSQCLPVSSKYCLASRTQSTRTFAEDVNRALPKDSCIAKQRIETVLHHLEPVCMTREFEQ